MKKTIITLVALILPFVVFLSGCQKDDLYEQDPSSPMQYGMYKDGPVYCGEQTSALLQDYELNITAGTIEIGNDEDYLYVTYTADPLWQFYAIYLDVGQIADIETAGDPGAEYFAYFDFPSYYYSNTTPLGSYTVQIAKSDINFDDDDCFVISAYAFAENIENPDAPVQYQMFATSSFSESPLGYYVDYCWEDCSPPEPLGGPRLSYAYHDDHSDCFKDIRRANAKYYPQGNGTWKNFQLWGWRNGDLDPGTYTMDLWAQVQGCNPTDGTLVGEVTIDFDGSNATITYEVDPAYTLISTYLYAGKKRLPKKWGNYYVLPWFYPNKHYQINSTTDTYNISGITGNKFYVIASALVKDAE